MRGREQVTVRDRRQRTAGWCKAAGQAHREVIPEQTRRTQPVSGYGCTRYRAGLCAKPAEGGRMRPNKSGTAECFWQPLSLGYKGQRLLFLSAARRRARPFVPTAWPFTTPPTRTRWNSAAPWAKRWPADGPSDSAILPPILCTFPCARAAPFGARSLRFCPARRVEIAGVPPYNKDIYC